MRLWLAPLVLTAIVFPRIAEACAPMLHCPGLIPAGDATVPANVPGFFAEDCWNSGVECTQQDPPDLVGPGGVVEADVTQVQGGWILSPRRPLQPGLTYDLRSHLQYSDPACTRLVPSVVHITAAQEAPLPERLGDLQVVDTGYGDVVVPTASGSCVTSGVGTHAAVQLDLSPEAEPYAAMLRVDYTPAGPGRIVALCQKASDIYASQGLPATVQNIVASASLPGGPSLTPAETQVDLTCPNGVSPSSCNSAGAPVSLAALGLVVGWLRRRRER